MSFSIQGVIFLTHLVYHLEARIKDYIDLSLIWLVWFYWFFKYHFLNVGFILLTFYPHLDLRFSSGDTFYYFHG